MSLDERSFNRAYKSRTKLNDRTNKLFKKLNLSLKDKVQMDHYGRLYLFGVAISEEYTNNKLIQIIQSTPEKSWNDHINEFGWFGHYGDKIKPL